MFSKGFCKVTAFATVTPSLVITGLPLPSSKITHFPLAPNVELTALVNFSTPVKIWPLAVSPKASSLTNSFMILQNLFYPILFQTLVDN